METTLHKEIKRIRKLIENESVSYDDILFLQQHQTEIKAHFSDDTLLLEWADIPENEELYHHAKSQFLELKEILQKGGILSMKNKEDFISKVWGIANYTPSRVDDDIIDLDYKNITATLVFENETPELLTSVEYFVGGNSEDYYLFDIEE